MTFKIKSTNKILTTPNLEKKLKRMKLTMEDIEILPNIEKPKKDTTPQLEFPNLEQVNIKSTKDDNIRVCQVSKGTRPSIQELFKHQIYNPITKTGLYTLEEINTFYYAE